MNLVTRIAIMGILLPILVLAGCQGRFSMPPPTPSPQGTATVRPAATPRPTPVPQSTPTSSPSERPTPSAQPPTGTASPRPTRRHYPSLTPPTPLLAPGPDVSFETADGCYGYLEVYSADGKAVVSQPLERASRFTVRLQPGRYTLSWQHYDGLGNYCDCPEGHVCKQMCPRNAGAFAVSPENGVIIQFQRTEQPCWCEFE
jgi:hypothetical protein